jgi:hypothetical protein
MTPEHAYGMESGQDFIRARIRSNTTMKKLMKSRLAFEPARVLN